MVYGKSWETNLVSLTGYHSAVSCVNEQAVKGYSLWESPCSGHQVSTFVGYKGKSIWNVKALGAIALHPLEPGRTTTIALRYSTA